MPLRVESSVLENTENVKRIRNFINIQPAALSLIDQKINLISKGVFKSFEDMKEKQETILPKLYELESLTKTATEINLKDLSPEHIKIVEDLENQGVGVTTQNPAEEKFIKKSQINFQIRKINETSKLVFQKAESDLSLQKMLSQLGSKMLDLDGGKSTMIRNQKSN
jgi:hypothetical protein